MAISRDDAGTFLLDDVPIRGIHGRDRMVIIFTLTFYYVNLHF